MANALTVDQISTLLKAVIKEATGQQNIANLDTAQLLTIGQKTLATGRDPVMSAISQVISKTIFSTRPYSRKFAGMAVDSVRWGNIVRKIVPLESPNDVEDNPYITLTDGASVDQYTVHKPDVMELRFVGQQTYEICKTIFDTQLDTAFTSAEEFGRFVSMVFEYVYNKIEKIHEETARATISGMIAGKVSGDSANVIHLLTEYNTETGETFTKADIMKPANFGAFMKWVYSRVTQISDMMTEYSTQYHVNLTDGAIMRHTPKEFQRAYFYAPLFTAMTDRVLADTYHDNLLKLPGSEFVNFWQNIKTPEQIKVTTAKWLRADGTIGTSTGAVTVSDVFGVLCDTESMGYSPILERTKASPYNAKGEYTNYFWKFNERHFIDYTENCVVFLLN